MISVGRYLVFILSVTGTILSNDQFTDEKTGEFLQEIYRQHNVYRKKHGVNPLKFDKKISMEASKTLYDISTGKIDDSSEESEDVLIFLPCDADTKPDVNTVSDEFDNSITINADEPLDDVATEETQHFNKKYGFTFTFLSFDDDTKLDSNTAKKIVLSWYETGDEYNYYAEPSDIKAEKFTQMVWACTEKMGLALAIHKKIQKYAILIYYSPPGNQNGEYKNNVSRPQS